MKKIDVSLIISFVVLTITICFTSCDNAINNSDKPKSPEELRAELKIQEQMTPLNYLNYESVVLTPQLRKIREAGLFHDAEYVPDGAIIEGYIVNKATLARFKDVKIKVTFYSKTQTAISEQIFTIYEFFEPNTKKDFSIRINNLPDGYNTFSVEVLEATPVE
jgi:hypothetical protein